MSHNSRALRGAAAVIVFVSLAGAAHASGSGMPWEEPLQQVVDSLTGPVARAAGVVAIVIAGMAIMFSEGGSGVRKLAYVGLGIAIMFWATTAVAEFFGFAGGATI